MLRLQCVAMAIAASLCGCTWVMPRPSSSAAAAVASGTAANCQLDLVEARQASVRHIDAAGMAMPTVILRADGPSSDRVIRNGTRVILRSIAAVGDRAASSGTETAPLIIAPVGGAGSDPVEIRGDAVVQLRPRAPAVGGNAVARAAASLTTVDEFVIYKADVPDPNRPTTCDDTLRDGDFVYLRTIVPSAWVEVRDGTLAPSTQPSSAAVRCSTPDRECYTDRYGGLLCAHVRACSATSSL